MGRNNFIRAIRHLKDEGVDKKIDHLVTEMMKTSGFYNLVQQDDGDPYIPPTFSQAPLGDFSDLSNFVWNSQGDGSSNSHNLQQLQHQDAQGNIKSIFSLPDLDGYNGTPYVMAIGPNLSVTGSPLGYISDNGFNAVFQIGNVFSNPMSDFQRAFVEAYENGNFIQKSIQLWGPLLYRVVSTPVTPAAFYPSGRDFNTVPKAEKGLYTYNILIPVTPGTQTPIPNSVMSDAGQPATQPRVTNVISRNDLGDTNYYPGPVTNVSPEAINYLLSRIPPYVGRPPRNSPGPGPQNVQGPHQPVKYYPGMGFAPVGPVQPGPWRLANSNEPRGEVLSEEYTLTKNDFARLNKYVKDHPEELEYAFSRYPASDPRLSKLNWKMDCMNRANEEYLEMQFPINQSVFKRTQESIKKNIKLSNPKSFKVTPSPIRHEDVVVEKVRSVKKYMKPIKKIKPAFLRKKGKPNS